MDVCTAIAPLRWVSTGRVCRNMGDMADEGNAGTFEYTLSGKELTFKKVEPGQLIMLQRYVDGLRAKAAKMLETEDLDGILAIGRKISEATWTHIESQFISDEDLEWIQLEIIAGRIKESDLMPLLSNGIKRSEAEDDAEPVAVKRPGRKAPAAKKAAKRAAPSANPTRAKR